ncbi:MAG: SpoIID/LytB domain-containing protein [Chitinivibrionales bacterium]|nr:SpoIID/LytB domain-containing protein [Chitinivibrionales bacterium]
MNQEPTIAVGLVDSAEEITFQLLDEYTDGHGGRFGPGEYHVACRNGALVLGDGGEGVRGGLTLVSLDAGARFTVQVTIGIDFHWEQKQRQTFGGALRLLALPGNRLTAINDVPLESYILSVSCSEMSASSPEEFLKAHSIISRSWLLAQLESKDAASAPPVSESHADGEIIRWYDRQSHRDFDVCADDHCQRYQGMDMVTTGAVSRAVESTRGQVLTYDGRPCDARFSKCCGGVTEDFRLAWGDIEHPYLVPLLDGPDETLPSPPLSDEQAARAFMEASPDVYCNCTDEAILGKVLNDYDRTTPDFFRWRVRLTPDEIEELLQTKLGLRLGRILALQPVERGLSGRLKRLRLVGEQKTAVIGKELEIRRALSPTHLYSSAFVVNTEGPQGRPDAFVLHGAGWGHGVGLCQIGAAVMACRGMTCEAILRHYYPGSVLEHMYA